MKNLRFCNHCNKYTLETKCNKCKNTTISKNPPRFSPEDRYGKYRRKLKKQNIGEK